MTDCGTVPCIFNIDSGLCPVVITISLSVGIVGFAVLYRYRELLEGRRAYIWIVASVILFIGIFTAAAFPTMEECGGPTTGVGVSIDQDAGATAKITMVDTGNLDSWGLVGPDGTRSTMALFEAGTRFRLRSNDEVISYLNSPENNITVLTTSGTRSVENVGELPSEYQKAPEGLINPDANIGNYDNASVATVACLVSHDGVKIGDERVPANVTLPCNTPVLAQNDSVTVGTSVKPTSEPSAGKTLVSPIIYREDEEYTVIGTVDGEEGVIQTFTTEKEVSPEQDKRNEDDHRTASYRRGSGYLKVAGTSSLTPAVQEPTRGQRKSRGRTSKKRRGRMTADILNVLLLALLLVPAGLAVLGLVLVYRYRERLKEWSQYLYYRSILGVVILGVVISGVFFYASLFVSGILDLPRILGISIMLTEVAVLGLILVYRYPEQLKEQSQYIYYGSILGSVMLGVVVSYVLLTDPIYTYVSGCSADPCIFEGGLCTLVSVTAISVTLVGFSLLYMFRGLLKEKFPYVFYGSIGFIFLVGGAAVWISTSPVMTCGVGSAGVALDQNPGVVEITMVDTGSLDSWGLVGPDGTRSTMADFEPGTVFRLRSNDEVIRYLNDPENNITVLTTSGTRSVENVGELPSEYQKAPEGLIDPDADIGNYANASVATAACLIRHGGVKIGERQVPANVTLPCNTPVLAQNDSVTVGTSVKPTSGPSAGKTLVSHIIYREDEEYSVIGTVDGEERVIQTFMTAEALPEQNETKPSQPANNSTARSVRDR